MSIYSAFGLRFDSEIELGSATVQQTTSNESGGPFPSVIVRWGSHTSPPPPAPLASDGWFEFAGDTHRFGWAQLGIVEIAAAREVRVWPIDDVADGLVEHVLLGAVAADILLTRGLLPLHASANRVNTGVVAFAGRSGSGKSTLAAAMHASGHDAHGDDLIAVPCSGQPLVHCGVSRIKLNPDSALATGTDPQALRHVYSGIEKRSLRVRFPNTEPLPLRAVYRIVDDANISIVPVNPARSVFELLANCFRVEVEQHACGVQELLRRAAAVSESVPMFELRRPRDLARLTDTVSAVGEHAESLVRAAQ